MPQSASGIAIARTAEASEPWPPAKTSHTSDVRCACCCQAQRDGVRKKRKQGSPTPGIEPATLRALLPPANLNASATVSPFSLQFVGFFWQRTGDLARFGIRCAFAVRHDSDSRAVPPIGPFPPSGASASPHQLTGQLDGR